MKKVVKIQALFRGAIVRKSKPTVDVKVSGTKYFNLIELDEYIPQFY